MSRCVVAAAPGVIYLAQSKAHPAVLMFAAEGSVRACEQWDEFVICEGLWVLILCCADVLLWSQSGPMSSGMNL